MNENSNVVRLRHPTRSMIPDQYPAIRCATAAGAGYRAGSRGVSCRDEHFRLADGRDRVVRHGHGPERTIQTGASDSEALDEVFPGTRHQRCWVHKTANVLNKVALSVQAT